MNKYFDNISKDNLFKNNPKTQCRLNTLIKESNNKNSIKDKNTNLYSNNKKEYKIEFIAKSISAQDNFNKGNKNNSIKSNDIKLFSNSTKYNNCFSDSNNYYSEICKKYCSKNAKKKADYLLFFENNKTKNKPKSKNCSNQDNNLKQVNKNQSFVNTSNMSYNSLNYYISNTVKKVINSPLKNNKNNSKSKSKSKSRPSSLLLSKKLKEEKLFKNKAKPMNLIQSSKSKEKNNKNNSKSKDIIIKNNFQINTTHINYYNDCKISNSNYFLKNNIFFNKTCSNDIYHNNLTHSEKNPNPIIIKEKILKNKKNYKAKEIKKSQSQSHLYHKNSEYSTKDEKNLNKSKQKNDIKKTNLSQKKIYKNKYNNCNLNINNINNINNYNEKCLFSYSNMSESSSSQKNRIVNIKYPFETDKNIIINDNHFNSLNNIPSELSKDELFNKIINLWKKIGGIKNTYIDYFIKYTINSKDRYIIFQNEINELNLILNSLSSLNEKIQKRNDILEKLKMISNINNDINIDEMKNLLNNLSLISMNIINSHHLFIKEISFDLLLNKYNIEKINNFDINYLSQMIYDTNFLYDNPCLNKNSEFNKSYPFLSFFSEGQETNDINNKINEIKCIMFKNNIFQDLFKYNLFCSNNFNCQTEDNIINSYNSSKRKILTEENIITPKQININNNHIINNNKNSNNTIEKNINFYIESKKIHNAYNSINNNNKKDNDIYRNDHIYNKENININAFTFGHETVLPKVKDDILKIEPYNKKQDPKLPLLYISYLSSIDDNMKLSFNINNDIYYYSQIGIYPKILLFKDFKSNVKAICTLSYDHILFNEKKILTITSISCMNEYKISLILNNLIKYCKEHEISFDAIEINLYYIKKDGKFVLNEDLEKEIKNGAKFKWVKLENDGEKRKIKYRYMNDGLNINNNSNPNRYDINSTKLGISILNYSLIKYYEEFGEKNILYSEHSQLYFILNLVKSYYILNNKSDEINQIMTNFSGIKLKKIIRILSEYCYLLETNPKDFKNDYSNKGKLYLHKEFLYPFLDIIEKNKNTDEEVLCLSRYNIFTNFSSIIKSEINEYEYNIISMAEYSIETFDADDNLNYSIKKNLNNFNIYDNDENINISGEEKNYVESNGKGNFYFIKSEKDKISFIIYELKEDQNINITQQEINILFNKVLQKILVKDNEEPIKSYKKIGVPSFTYKNKNNKGYKNENQYKVQSDLNLINHNLFYFYEEIAFCIENLKYNDIKFSFPLSKKIENDDDIKIIKNNFVIAVINQDLILDYHIPATNIFYINKEHWIKI